MRYNKIDAQMKHIVPEAYKAVADEALAEFLAARRAAKPRLAVKASGFCVIRGRGFETYGFSTDDALRRWKALVRV